MSTHEPEHQYFDELAAGYACDALEPSEEAEFLRHADGCARCRAALVEAHELLGQLAALAPGAEPPPELLDSLRAAIQASDRPAIFTTGRSGGPARGGPRSRLHRGRSFARAAAVPALLALLLAAGAGGWAIARPSRPNQVEQALALRDDVLQEMVVPGSRLIPLGTQSGAAATAVITRTGTVYLVATNLPKTPASWTYELWAAQPGGGMAPVDRFRVGTPRLAVVRVGTLPVELLGTRKLAISRQPVSVPPVTPSDVVLGGGTLLPWSTSG